MGLVLITGLSNVGRSGRLYRGVRADAARGVTPVVLFPTAPDARRAAREFAAQGVLGVRTAVLDRWVADVWGLWGDGRRLVAPAQRVVLAGEAAVRAEAGLLSESAGHSGFVHSLASLARQVTEPEGLTCHSAYDDEMRTVLVTYARLLEEHGLIEPALAVSVLSEDPPSGLPPLYINRFTDLSPAQERMLVAFSRGTRVSLVLPWEPGRGATAALEPLVRRLAHLGEHEHVEAGIPNDELGTLGASIFEEGGLLEATGMVRMGEALDPGREVTRAVDVVGEAIREGADPSRIAMTFRSAASRSSAVIAAAGEAGIPLYVDLRVPLVSVPLARALFALLDVVTGRDGSRERLAAYLQSVYSGVTYQQAARLDRRIRIDRASGSDALSILEAQGDGASRAVRAAAGLSGGQSPDPSRWKELVDALIANAREARTEELWTMRLDAAAHAGVLGVVESIAALDAEPGVKLVRSALEHESVHFTAGDESTGVHFTEAGRVRATRYDMVVLGGMNADEFSSERDPTWEAGFLERAGLGTEAEGRARERLLFYSLVTRARDRLVLLRSTGEGDDGETRPSVFWNEVADRYREATEEDHQLPEAVSLAKGDGGRAAMTSAIAHIPGRRAERGEGRALPRPVRSRDLRGEVLERLGSAEEFSATEIETYLSCPRRWFFGYVLRPEEIDRDLGLREWGSAAHEILVRFYRSWIDGAGGGRITQDTCGSALELLEEVMARTFAGYPVALGVEEECGVEEVRKRTRRVIEDDERYLPGFEPTEVEMRFGARHERPVEFGGVRVRGSVDRIDIRDASLFVTDYKSGATVRGHGSFAANGLVQLPVYAVAAATVLGSRPVGAVYRSLVARKARGFWLSGAVDLCEWGTRTDGIDEDGFAQVIEAAEERVSEAVSGIRAGRVEPRPCDGCRFCGAAPICDVGGAR